MIRLMNRQKKTINKIKSTCYLHWRPCVCLSSWPSRCLRSGFSTTVLAERSQPGCAYTTTSYVHCISLRCNFIKHQPILIICRRKVTEKVSNEMCFIFKHHLTSASALSGKKRLQKIASFHLNAVLVLFYQTSTSRCLISSVLLTCNRS